MSRCREVSGAAACTRESGHAGGHVLRGVRPLRAKGEAMRRLAGIGSLVDVCGKPVGGPDRIGVACIECGVPGVARAKAGAPASRVPVKSGATSGWLAPPPGWAISPVWGGDPGDLAFRCARCAFGAVSNPGREHVTDDREFGRVLGLGGELQRAGVRATTCLLCERDARVVVVGERGRFATDDEIAEHLRSVHALPPKGGLA